MNLLPKNRTFYGDESVESKPAGGEGKRYTDDICSHCQQYYLHAYISLSISYLSPEKTILALQVKLFFHGKWGGCL